MLFYFIYNNLKINIFFWVFEVHPQTHARNNRLAKHFVEFGNPPPQIYVTVNLLAKLFPIHVCLFYFFSNFPSVIISNFKISALQNLP